MDAILTFLFPALLVVFGYGVGSTKVIEQGNGALVERLGKYHRKLEPGLNFVVPLLDKVAVEETLREQVLDTKPQEAITKDSVVIKVDAVVYWKIVDLQKAYYNVEDIEEAITNLIITRMRSAIGSKNLDETYAGIGNMNQELLNQLRESTQDWGIEILDVGIQEIVLPDTVRESLEREREAQSLKQAEIYKAEGTKKSFEIISQALQDYSNSQQVLKFLIAQQYVEASEKLSASTNTKVVFMDPSKLTEATTELMSEGFDDIAHVKKSDRPLENSF